MGRMGYLRRCICPIEEDFMLQHYSLRYAS